MRRSFVLTGLSLVGGAALFAAVAVAAVSHPGLNYNPGAQLADPDLNALDLYVPDGVRPGDDRPVVVYVHGGGWAIGDKANSIADKVNLFTGAGYVFASVNYRLSPADAASYDPGRIRFPDHPADIGVAIGWLARHVANYGGDPTRMLLIGHSAGAHLVSLVSTDPSYISDNGVEPWRIIGTVSLDTDAFDVAERISELGQNGRPTFYNAFGTPEEEAADPRWAAASPVLWADRSDPRILLVAQAARADRVADNQRMATALGQDPGGVFLAPYDHEGINDAVGSATDNGGETAAIMSFINARVRAAKDPVAKLRGHPDKVVHTNRKRVRVEFELNSPTHDARFECRLDARELRRCPAQRRLVVDPGRHTFRYRAIAASGRPGNIGSFRFRVAAG